MQTITEEESQAIRKAISALTAFEYADKRLKPILDELDKMYYTSKTI